MGGWAIIVGATVIGANMALNIGANDVTNAIGPLAAIHATVNQGQLVAQAQIPFWILLMGGFGIATSLLLFGPKLIRTVGSKITKLNRLRAFCVTLSAAITAIIASALGMPVSSTHIAIGALFGVGFLREYMANRSLAGLASMPLRAVPTGSDEPLMENPEISSSGNATGEKQRRRYLVRRSHLINIVSAWLITVPASACLSAVLALVLSRLQLVTLS